MSRQPSLPTLSTSLRLATLLSLVLLLSVMLAAGCARQEPPPEQNALVVVQFADGSTYLRSISWTGDLTRVAALERAGLSVAADAAGEAVCAIEGQGCPADNCFCPENLWAQGQWDGNGWNSDTWPPPPVQDGDVIAFRMGTQPDYSDWGLAGHLADAPSYLAAQRALAWLRTQQQADGSYDDGFDAVGASVRTLLALGAAGEDAAAWGNPSLLTYLTDTAAERTRAYAQGSPAAAGKLAVAATWAGLNPADLAGLDLPTLLAAAYDPSTGAYGGGSGDTVWAILGLRAAGQPVPANAIAFLESVQHDDGGWAWNEMQAQSEIQHTAIVVQALLAADAPHESETVTRALALLRSSANPDGGYPYQSPGESDLGTTAAVIQAFLVVGEPGDAEAVAAARAYLVSQQGADGAMQGWSPLYATQECLPALLGRAFGPRAQGR